MQDRRKHNGSKATHHEKERYENKRKQEEGYQQLPRNGRDKLKQKKRQEDDHSQKADRKLEEIE